MVGEFFHRYGRVYETIVLTRRERASLLFRGSPRCTHWRHFIQARGNHFLMQCDVVWSRAGASGQPHSWLEQEQDSGDTVCVGSFAHYDTCGSSLQPTLGTNRVPDQVLEHEVVCLPQCQSEAREDDEGASSPEMRVSHIGSLSASSIVWRQSQPLHS